MNPLHDSMPDIPACPKCGHDGEGLNWSFPDMMRRLSLTRVQCACLACGAHGETAATYSEAVENFKAGKLEAVA